MRCPVPYALLALLGWGAADAAAGRIGGWLGFRRWIALVHRRRGSSASGLRYEETPSYNKVT